MECALATLSKKPKETGAIRQSMSAADATDLSETISGLDKEMFDVSIKIKEFLYPYDYKVPLTPTEATSHGVRLPKLDVPTFDGDILNWSTFYGAVLHCSPRSHTPLTLRS